MDQPKSSKAVGRLFTQERRDKYLAALEQDGEHTFARIEVGITAQTIRQHRAKDVEFDQACEDAQQRYRKRFVDELVRRGVDGVEKPVFHEGMIVGHVTEYSDRLLLEHLKVVDKRYRNQLDLEVGAHITTAALNLETLQPESRALLEQILVIEAAAQTMALNVPDES
tara:strand:+ start:15326 stop:15829 length:504 start_codon:yes stop_codon:yes gene_type:complete